MIDELLARPSQRGVTHLITTVTDDNLASWNLFRRLARERGAALDRSVAFERERHFAGVHPTEYLARIGPIHHDKIHEKRG